MDVQKQFRTDEKLEIEGAWFDIGDGGRLLIARKGNARYRHRLRGLVRGKERQLRLDTLPEHIADQIMVAVMADTVLLGWDGLDWNGEPLPYSIENATKLLTELPDFRNLVDDLSEDMAAFRADRIGAAEKN